MRVLQISDTHLGMALNARGPRGWRRADDHHEALERALQPALREEVDLVVHAGDVFNRSSPPRRDVLRAGALFAEVARRVPVLGIAGNHDRKGIQRWLPQRSLRFVDQPTRTTASGLDIALVPFRRTAEGFAHAARIADGADLLVCHQAFDGSRVPGFTFRPGRPRETLGERHLPRVHHIAAGHVHPRQALTLGAATIVHGGSTERTAFSEAPQPKGAVIWDFSGPRPTWRFVDHATRPMHVDGPIHPGVLVRCAPEAVPSVRRQGGIAVVRRSRYPPGGG